MEGGMRRRCCICAKPATNTTKRWPDGEVRYTCAAGVCREEAEVRRLEWEGRNLNDGEQP